KTLRDIVKDQYLFVYGIFYPQGEKQVFEAKTLDFPGKSPGEYCFEEPNWWINQARSVADFFINSQFGGPDGIDYRKYRTSLKLTGEKKGDARQETDTISRMVFGLASTFLLTGEDRFLEAAEKGSDYLRDHMQLKIDDNTVCWYHGIDVDGEKDRILIGSEFGDDYHAVPMYEQIYALAGPTQTYRVNGDPLIMNDIKMTINLFDRFLDTEQGGYFSHIDPFSHDPRSENLGHNKSRKNWNSVGDHAPAFLINLWLATGDPAYEEFLVYTADCIEKYFPDYENSPFVNEKFFEDWSHDQKWGWQQNRAVVGHNLKIAWNLMRINSLAPNDRYTALANKIAKLMPEVGMDRQRAGWYDVVERT
ncbi:N-acyl-D-glucosamine 2-epimerase, partial [Dolichospermum sp. ST_sed5]|nr:N-acyl-D-glucosamine 2-epimerase [Dolichospermum sp. ST_sed5]